jgi:hypothetical protein
VGAVPTTFDRMNNRRYGGEIGSARPPWWTPIDAGNELAQYALFWSWMSHREAEEGILPNNAVPSGTDDGTVARGQSHLIWEPDGLTVTQTPTIPTVFIWLPGFTPGLDDFTIVVDYTPAVYCGPSADLLNTNTDTCVWGAYGMSLEKYGTGMVVAFRDIRVGPPIAFWFPDAVCWTQDERFRTVVSVDRDGLIALFVNGVLANGAQNASPAQPYDVENTGLFNRPDPLVGDLTTNYQFVGTVHEVGFLSGYAATAHDVANNAMFAIPYGGRGSFLPVTDAPVA